MLTDIDILSVEYICLNMREDDKREILAMRPHDSQVMLAWEAYHMIRNNGRGRIAWHDGRPAALAAFTEAWPGHWNVWMFGTKDFRAAAVPLIRWIRDEAREILSVCKGLRLECDSIADHDEAHKMIRALGGKAESEMRNYGKGGETFIKFVWLPNVNDAVLSRHYVRADAATQEA